MRIEIIGAGGHGKVAADIAELCGYSEIVFFDDTPPMSGKVGPWTVAGGLDDMAGDGPIAVAIGDAHVRRVLCGQIAGELTSLIHPSAVVSPYAEIGSGCLIAAGAIINPFAVLETGVIVNTGASVDHDCKIGGFAHIAPGARLAGTVTVGACSFVGIGAVVRQGLTIGRDVVVGAGAAVVEDMPDNVTVTGVPARPVSVRSGSQAKDPSAS